MDRIETWEKKKRSLYEELEAIYKDILAECGLTEDVVTKDIGHRGRIKVEKDYLGKCSYKFYPYKQNGALSNRGYTIYGCDINEREIRGYLLNKYCKAEAK